MLRMPWLPELNHLPPALPHRQKQGIIPRLVQVVLAPGLSVNPRLLPACVSFPPSVELQHPQILFPTAAGLLRPSWGSRVGQGAVLVGAEH